MCFICVILVSVALYVNNAEPYFKVAGNMNVLDHNITKSSRVYDNEETNIVGGFKARSGQFPYIASIQKKINAFSYWHTCGGSIIAEQFILSAAHCFPKPIEAAKYVIKVGSVTLSKAYQTRNVGGITVHSKYKYKDIVKGYDIAILRLTKSFEFNKFVNSVEIGYSVINESEYCVTAGWGSHIFEGNKFPKHLKGLMVQLHNVSYCLRYTPALSAYAFCAGGEIREDTCVGDSGGPLVCDGKQLGVISYGSDLCGQGIPTYFSNVTAFKDWIEETMATMDGGVNGEGIKIHFHHYILIISHLFLFIFLPSI